MIETFLTAFDPSDLPGTSIDPLGFERGYLFLADKILPGLTNVASRPRYFALLCAGIHMCDDTAERTEMEAVRNRQQTILRLERFWALANVLAYPADSGGVRGVTYAQAYAQELSRAGATRTKADYRLLSRQTQYGAIGMYASVADGMRYFNRDDFILTPDLGEVAAEAFERETQLPSSLRRALVQDLDVSLSTLRDWGKRAHVDAEVGSREAACLSDAVHSNDVRSRMIGVLRDYPFQHEEELEGQRLLRVLRNLRRTKTHEDLTEAIEAILAYEECYQLLMLAFERILWLCRQHAAACLSLNELASDSVLERVKTSLPSRAKRLARALDESSSDRFRQDLDRLSDVRRFVESAAAVIHDNSAFVDVGILRHSDVQHGKFDRGRRKMPWLEISNQRIQLTMARAGGLKREVMRPDEITPHPYRLNAADAYINAAEKAVAA